MAATDTITDVDLEALWEEALPCHWYECDEEPTHKTVMPCCGKEWYWCPEHLEHQRNFNEARRGLNDTECRACGAVGFDSGSIKIRPI